MSNLNRTKVRRETTNSMPSALPLGEVAFNSETCELFIGTGTSKKVIKDTELTKAFTTFKTSTETTQKELSSQLETKANKDTTDDMQGQINNLVLGAVGDGNNPEVIQARGKYNLLSERLIANDNKTSVINIFEQFLVNTNTTIGKVYFSGDSWCASDDNLDYKIWSPIQLKSGTYYYKNISLAFSVIQKSQYEFKKLNSVITDVTDDCNHTGSFTVDYDFTFYVSTMKIRNDSMLSNQTLPNVYTEGFKAIFNINEEDLKNKVEEQPKTYSTLSDDSLINLNTYTYSKNGSATVYTNIATVTGAYGGIVTNEFEAKNILDITVHTTFTTSDVMIMFSYYNGTWNNETIIKNITGGSAIKNFKIDCNNYFVYKGATKYRILVLTEKGSNGTITLNNVTINDLDDFRNSKYYNNKLIEMQKNIISGVVSNEGKINTLELKKPTLTDANGKKYMLNVNTDGTISTTPLIPSKILFMGNSLVFGLDTDNSKGGHFGMCASDYTKDFKYLVQQNILSKNSNATFTDKSIALFEQCETNSDSLTKMNEVLTACTNDLDLIICQIGDNVSNATRQVVFENNFNSFISKIRVASPRARLIFVGCWYNANYSKDTIVKGCKNYGCEFVDITYLNTLINQATTGSTITYKNGTTGTVLSGWASHPGDVGMQLIADDINNTLGI